MITLKDITPENNHGYRYSLSKLITKKIKDVHGYISSEFGDPTFKLTEIIFEDGTELGVEGEHDFPYVVQYRTQPQPNFDDETLQRLKDEMDNGTV